MQDKNYTQMLEEVLSFYESTVKNMIPDINRQRVANNINSVAFFIIMLGFVLAIVLPFVFKMFALLLSIIGFTIAFALNNDEPKKNTKSIVDVDFKVKQNLMQDFLKIFGEGMYWGNIYIKRFQAQFVKNLKLYNSLGIMNPYILLSAGDIIYGTYRKVKFNLIEANTFLLSYNNIFALFLIVLLTVFIIIPLLCLLGFAVYKIGTFMFNAGLEFVYVYAFLVLLFCLYKLILHVSFRGVVINFEMNKKFVGKTIVLERAKTRRGIKIDYRNLQEVKLEDTEFMKKYIVMSDNQVEARYLLTTGFIERFNNIKTTFNAQYIRAAFKDGKIYLVLHSGKDLFSMVDILKDTNGDTFVTLFDELYSVFNLVDELKLNQHIGL